jgi:hypothetical protein
MIKLYPHAPTAGRLGFRSRFPRPYTWVTVKTVDRDEQLILDPRDSGFRRSKIWEGGRRIVLLSVMVLLALLVLCFACGALQ